MDDTALQVANKFWKNECRDDKLSRMLKQKHAAHVQVYRLKKQLQEKELERGLLLVVYLATSRHNEILQSAIRKYIENPEDLSSLQI